MHIHAAQASALGNALAGAQDAETAVSMRRARELRDAALRLKAASLEIYNHIPQNPESTSETDSETASQAVTLIHAWSGNGSAQPDQSSNRQTPASPLQEVQRTPPTGPVSYWA